jgi:hypothetical protein
MVADLALQENVFESGFKWVRNLTPSPFFQFEIREKGKDASTHSSYRLSWNNEVERGLCSECRL